MVFGEHRVIIWTKKIKVFIFPPFTLTGIEIAINFDEFDDFRVGY